MSEPEKRDIVEEARRLLAKDTPAPWLRIEPELLRLLCDEVERLRSEVKRSDDLGFVLLETGGEIGTEVTTLRDENSALREQIVNLERQRNEALDQCAALHEQLAGTKRDLRMLLISSKAAINDASTRMRDKCVEQLQSQVESMQEDKGNCAVSVRIALHEAISTIASLILESTE